MSYHLRRIGQAFLTLIVVTTFTFVLYRMLPGGPIDALVATRMQECLQSGRSDCDPERIRRNVESTTNLNIDPSKPIPAAFLEYISDIVLRQDFGHSFLNNEPVFEVLFKAMPWSIFVSLYGLAFGFAFNIFLGAAMAYKEGSRFDAGATIFAMIGNSIPYYVAAIVALSYFSYQLGWFPTDGRFSIDMVIMFFGNEIYDFGTIEPSFSLGFMLTAMHHAALPIFTGFVLGISGLGMRGNAIRVMGSDYLRVARLRGLSQSRIASRYVARNAILPLYTGFLIGIAGIFGSGIIMERIFTYRAVGWYTFDALVNQDYALLMGSFLFYTTITLIGIVLADFTYGLVDPRAGSGGDRESF